MKRFMLTMCLMMVSMACFGQSIVTVNNGKSGTTFKVWVGTTAYNIIPANLAGAYSCYTIKAMEGQFWFDYDSSVSTWNAESFDDVGMRAGRETGENAQIKVNEHITINGLLDDEVYVKSDLITGCTMQCIINRIY